MAEPLANQNSEEMQNDNSSSETELSQERVFSSTSSITDIPPALNNPIGRKIIAIANKYAGGDVTVMYRIYELLKKPTPGNIFKAAKLLGSNADQILPAIAALLFTPAVGKIVKAAFFIYKKKRYIIYGLAVIVFVFFLITYVVQDLWNWVKDNKTEAAKTVLKSVDDSVSSVDCRKLAQDAASEPAGTAGYYVAKYSSLPMALTYTVTESLGVDLSPDSTFEIDEPGLIRQCAIDLNLTSKLLCARRGLDNDCFKLEE